jgi:DNA replication protein DnaC
MAFGRPAEIDGTQPPLLGPQGVGKAHLGDRARGRGGDLGAYTVKFATATTLVTSLAKASGPWTKPLGLAKPKLLIIDELGYLR